MNFIFLILNRYSFLAPIEVEILFIFSLKIKRLQRIAGIASYNY
ncbi:hypothetical protein RCH33_921 [Flavobacterium daejeonense]|nr:hypothetical protein RCH33_921 [Flavobacterium daejeonense]